MSHPNALPDPSGYDYLESGPVIHDGNRIVMVNDPLGDRYGTGNAVPGGEVHDEVTGDSAVEAGTLLTRGQHNQSAHWERDSSGVATVSDHSAAGEAMTPRKKAGQPSQPRPGRLAAYLAARDKRYADTPYTSPYSADMGDFLKQTTERLWEDLPELVGKSEVGEWLSKMALRHAVANYGERLRKRKTKQGPVKRYLGEHMPNRTQIRDAKRVEKMAEKAAEVGVDAVVNRRVKPWDAVSRAFASLGDVPVYAFPMDGRYYVQGSEVVRVLEAYCPDDPEAEQVSPAIRGRRDVLEVITRDNGSKGEIDKGIFVSVEDVNDRRTTPRTHYVAGIRSSLMGVPGKERKVISEVAAVELTPNIVHEVNVWFNTLTDVRTSNIGRSVLRLDGGKVLVNIEESHKYQTDPEAIGIVTRPENMWGHSIEP